MIPPPMHGRCLIKHSKRFSIPGTIIIAIVLKCNIYTLQHSFQTKCICILLGYEFSDAALAPTCVISGLIFYGWKLRKDENFHLISEGHLVALCVF